jgi:hypothetical protein
MCGPKRRTADAAGAETRSDESYEGATIRLGSEQALIRPTKSCGWHGGGFPWWTIWLIWPLMGLIKTSAPAIITGVTAVAQLSVPLLPLLLIVIGLWLLRRR